ncbi:lipase family protein [Aeromonas popoffii]|uniref:Lipase family protein n=1 Tax=Aeromonas popoffii TaxID=70856 RepID=A0ABS5GMX8_9GAMM|nr:lipase family protein [Aeromonas popoffii]MBR7627709.1 lipase family protein [Aeromonas popoffii]
MKAATPRTLEGCVDCKMLKYEAEIKLVDELGQPLPNLPYVLWVGHGPKKIIRQGKQSSGDGVIVEKELPPGPLYLMLQADPLAEVLQEPHRHLRLSRSDYGTPVQREAEQQGRLPRYARFGQLVDRLPSLFEEEQQKEEDKRHPLPPYHFPHGDPAKASVARRPLYIFSKAGARSIKLTLEITPLRAWVLMLEHSPEYNLGNAHNLALMAHLAYAGGDVNEANTKRVKEKRKTDPKYMPSASERARSITHFFVEQMQDLSRLPYGINALSKAALVKDVPYLDRYETPIFIDCTEPGKEGEAPPSDMFGGSYDTQFFYVQRPEELIVSWRGTASLSDGLTDGNFTPVPCQEMSIANQGKAHQGFYNQFAAVTKHPDSDIAKVYTDITTAAKGKKLFICGHSLGGALALLHAASLKANSPLLYTYGMPRTLTESALRELTFPHFRHRNESDEVTSVPPGRGFDHPGANIVLFGKVFSVLALGLPDKDPYGHHGKLVHFDYTDTHYWVGAGKQREKVLLTVQTKLLVIPHLAVEGKASMDAQAKAALANAYPPGDNPSHGGGANIHSHPSGEYAAYLQKRVLGLLDKQHNLPDPNEAKAIQYGKVLIEKEKWLAKEVSWRENGALQIDNQLHPLLPQGQTEPEQFAITRLWQAPRK